MAQGNEKVRKLRLILGDAEKSGAKFVVGNSIVNSSGGISGADQKIAKDAKSGKAAVKATRHRFKQ